MDQNFIFSITTSKETVDMHILIASRNCDRKIMQPITTTKKPLKFFYYFWYNEILV